LVEEFLAKVTMHGLKSRYRYWYRP